MTARNRVSGPSSGRAAPSATARRPRAAPSGGGIRAEARGDDAAARRPEVVVVGDVPVLARVAGALLVLAGALAAVAAFPTYLVVGGTTVSAVTGPLDAVVALVSPVAAVLVGISLVLARMPRLGLAYAAVAGSLAVGRLLIELYQGHGSTNRPAVEVLDGERVLTSSVQTGPGWLLGVVALSVTVLAGLVALLAWGRTVMEDGGSLDPL
ncbi:MAG TPA: hypothetical protein VFY14_21560, partial [Streptomyces sp.]|nr:hypothetical protein [Streptomyces sp.]